VFGYIYKNDCIVTVDMDNVGVMAAYCVCSSLYMKSLGTRKPVTKSYHYADLVHVIGHDRILLVIFSQALYKSP